MIFSSQTHPQLATPGQVPWNLRDLGGIAVRGGVVASGEVFRSASLAQLTDVDARALAGRGIETVYDLRTAAERLAGPDAEVPGARAVDLDVLGDSPLSASARLGELVGDPALLTAALASGEGARLLEESYRNFVELPSARAAYHALITDLADDSRAGAALFHCTAGKDRTGWAATLILTILGASLADIEAEYLRTNTDLLPELQPLLDQAAAAGIDPDLLRPVLGVHPQFLEAAYAEVEREYASMAEYIRVGLGIDTETQERLRERLVTAAP